MDAAQKIDNKFAIHYHALNLLYSKYLDGTWEKFEEWIREKIGSGFHWCVRPRDTATNREMIANLVLNDIKRNNGVLPAKNTFIEKAQK